MAIVIMKAKLIANPAQHINWSFSFNTISLLWCISWRIFVVQDVEWNTATALLQPSQVSHMRGAGRGSESWFVRCHPTVAYRISADPVESMLIQRMRGTTPESAGRAAIGITAFTVLLLSRSGDTIKLWTLYSQVITFQTMWYYGSCLNVRHYRFIRQLDRAD
ncbi:hypothetical protein J6590_025174 [Homalodisca vitripennis]|nr:hypothetical protein J6590_025174 [Homalodisca vitripennis]